MKRKLCILSVLVAVAFWANSAMAYSFYLCDFNVTGYTGPYAEVKVNLIGNQKAKISVDALAQSGYQYLLAQEKIFDFNVGTVAISIGSVNTSNSYSGFDPNSVSFSTPNQNNVDGWGDFTWIGDPSENSIKYALTHIDFEIT